MLEHKGRLQPDGWQRGRFTIESFELESGVTLPNVEIVYVSQGKLNAEKSNVVLVLHGYTSSHEFVCAQAESAAEGSWAQLVGPGKALDTDQYLVIAPNALGSCFGSTGPASMNPHTGRQYGPSFPAITFKDIVGSQYELIRHMGINSLAAVVGISMGGFAAWQWGIQYPGLMQSLAVVLSSLKGAKVVPDHAQSSLHRLQSDPHWNGGWVYDSKSIQPALRALRTRTLLAYSAGESKQTAEIGEQAQRWAEVFDPNSLVVLGRAIRGFNAEPQIARLLAPVFLMLATTDRLFPAARAHETLDVLLRHGVRCRYLELETEYGHQASGKEWHKWADALQQFLADTIHHQAKPDEFEREQ